MKEKKRVDWSAIVFDLNRNKMNNTKIAAEVKVSSQTVRQWRDDIAKPNYHNGVLLSSLWMRTVILDHNHIPITFY